MNDARNLLNILNEVKLIEPNNDVPTDPEFVYHCTNEENAADIAHSGMIPHAPSFGTDQSCWPDGRTEKRSYFGATAGSVWMFAPEHGRPVILRIRRASATFKKESCTGDIYCNSKIPGKAFEILTVEGWRSITSVF